MLLRITISKGFWGKISFKFLNRALELGSTTPAIFSMKGLAYQRLGDTDKGLYYMDMALKKDSKDAVFYIRRSDLYVEIKKYEQSIVDLTQALDITPEDAMVFYKRGLSYYFSKKYKNAIQDFKDSLKHGAHESYEPDLHYHVGIAYSNLESFEDAIEPLSRAIKLCPYEAVYMHERAKAYLLTGNFCLRNSLVTKSI